MKKTPVPAGQRTPPRRPPRKDYIPREFAPLLHAFAVDAHQRLELWCYALILLMIDEEQVRQVGVHELAGRTWLTVETPEHEEFDVVKPQLSEEDERKLLDGVREIVERHKRPAEPGKR